MLLIKPMDYFSPCTTFKLAMTSTDTNLHHFHFLFSQKWFLWKKKNSLIAKVLVCPVGMQITAEKLTPESFFKSEIIWEKIKDSKWKIFSRYWLVATWEKGVSSKHYFFWRWKRFYFNLFTSTSTKKMNEKK